ncbi:MAG: hypothetical protein HYX32_09320 [Actinobacteria bacterium]|nr:hypothetical protein [Actinomycetota bacterium]
MALDDPAVAAAQAELRFLAPSTSKGVVPGSVPLLELSSTAGPGVTPVRGDLVALSFNEGNASPSLVLIGHLRVESRTFQPVWAARCVIGGVLADSSSKERVFLKLFPPTMDGSIDVASLELERGQLSWRRSYRATLDYLVDLGDNIGIHTNLVEGGSVQSFDKGTGEPRGELTTREALDRAGFAGVENYQIDADDGYWVQVDPAGSKSTLVKLDVASGEVLERVPVERDLRVSARRHGTTWLTDNQGMGRCLDTVGQLHTLPSEVPWSNIASGFGGTSAWGSKVQGAMVTMEQYNTRTCAVVQATPFTSYPQLTRTGSRDNNPTLTTWKPMVLADEAGFFYIGYPTRPTNPDRGDTGMPLQLFHVNGSASP